MVRYSEWKKDDQRDSLVGEESRRGEEEEGSLSHSLDAPSQRAILSSLQTGVRPSDEIICSSFPGIPWAGGFDTQRRQSAVAARRGGGARKGSPRNEPSMYVRGRSQRGGASLLLQGLADTWAWENDRRSPAVSTTVESGSTSRYSVVESSNYVLNDVLHALQMIQWWLKSINFNTIAFMAKLFSGLFYAKFECSKKMSMWKKM